MPDPMTPDDIRKAAQADYGTYVAKDTVIIDGVRAFNQGDPVPASHVERGVVSHDDVVKVSTKAGQALVENKEA